MPTEAIMEVSFRTLAANAPRKMAGQSSRPRRTSSASASPVAGQMMETCLATTANSRPSREVAKYTIAAASTSMMYAGRRAFDAVASGCMAGGLLQWRIKMLRKANGRNTMTNMDDCA